ncbi:MAG: flagellin [Methylococcaceae bacterium]|nr:flagellin [Methylococcaceae bacterium]MDP2392872.1 flagellin [Methylococcaceae bacterium]MDP3020400.1 flagellin [Methylococcaceae bacterium]MDP3392007.1 flagellin [Methylococcaceae bacterium]MDP3931334.1 flagellin [Methylococcaceae bacterium]
MIINTNLASLNSQRMLDRTNNDLKTSMERLSSGLRVNSAKDDAAGLAISNRMTSQIRGMTVATRNANDGISLAQTAEAAMGVLTDTMQRMRDLAVQSANDGAVTGADRDKLNSEFKQLNDELTRIVTSTEFNGKKIINGSLAGGIDFQVGANTSSDNRIAITIDNLASTLTSVTAATVGDGILTNSATAAVIDSDLSTVLASAVAATYSGGAQGARDAIDAIDNAIKSIDTSRAKLGAAQNRFTTTISNLQSSIENQSAARSRITDADFAMETANLSRTQILQQAGTAMLAQANQSTQSVLKLLQ